MSEVMSRRALAGIFVEVKAGNIVEVKAKDIVAVNAADERVHCDDCGSDEVYRIFRKGFLQQKIYPLFGFFPWRCKGCGLRLMLRKRDLASKQDSTE